LLGKLKREKKKDEKRKKIDESTRTIRSSIRGTKTNGRKRPIGNKCREKNESDSREKNCRKSSSIGIREWKFGTKPMAKRKRRET